jgi:histidinol dehydrogenase
MKLRRLSTRAPGFDRKLAALTRYEAAQDPAVPKTVRRILADVRARGDAAVREYTKKFDGVARKRLEIPQTEMQEAIQSVPRAQADALRSAFQRIRSFHEKQLQKSWDYTDEDGTRLGQRVTPLERVGLYVPGGKAAYPSSVLMNAIPAKVAGVPEVVMVSPNPNALVLAAAAIAGVDRVIAIGGAQAIAALAYGTASVPKVDKIVGPGNIFVATAKRLVFGEVNIDSIAGPSEILLLVDASADPRHVAADLLSQAEHDELAAALCVTTSMPAAAAIQQAVEHQVSQSKRQGILFKALANYGAIILARGEAEMIELANVIAPEHVELIVKRPQKLAGQIRNAGAIFLGAYSAPPLGAYMAGPNHVLPTGGSARFFSPLGTYDFLKRTTIIQAEKRALRALAPKITQLARLEGLDDHARAVEVRFEQ